MTYKDDQNYLNCTAQEKVWFDSFYETREPVAATEAAYRVNSKESAQAYAKKVMERDHIKALIASYVTQPVALPTIDDLKRKYIALSEDSGATVRDKLTALQAYERLCGFTVRGKPTPQSPDEDDLDDIND